MPLFRKEPGKMFAYETGSATDCYIHLILFLTTVETHEKREKFFEKSKMPLSL